MRSFQRWTPRYVYDRTRDILVGSRDKSWIPTTAYAGVLLITTLVAYSSPDYNFDLFGYMAAVESARDPDSIKIHSAVYRAAQGGMPRAKFEENVTATAFRRDLAQNPFHFAEQIPFYSVRPLYVELILLLHRLGLGVIKATRLVSALSLLGLGIVVFLWTRVYLDSFRSAVLAGTFVLTPPFLNLGRYATPDSLATFALVLALYLVFEMQRTAVPLGILCVSLFIRTDNLLVLVGVVGYLTLIARSPVRVPLRGAIVLVSLSLATVLAINQLAGTYSWSLLVHHTLIEKVVNPSEVRIPFSLPEYSRALRFCLGQVLGSGALLIFTFIGTACCMALPSSHRMKGLLHLALGLSVLRLLLFPLAQDRFFVWAYAVVVMALAAMLARFGEAQPLVNLGLSVERTEPQNHAAPLSQGTGLLRDARSRL